MNEEMFICQTEPDLYDITHDGQFSKQFRGCCAAIKDKVVHFLDATTSTDINSLTANEDCEFKLYEEKRLNNMSNCLQTALDKVIQKSGSMTEIQKEHTKDIVSAVEQNLKYVTDVLIQMTNGAVGKTLTKLYDSLSTQYSTISDIISGIELPQVRPNVFDLTDGGPGVSVTNHEVKYRAAERI